MTRGAMDICLRVLKETEQKSRFDSCSVRNSILIKSHITFRDCRVHIFPTTLLELAVYTLYRPRAYTRQFTVDIHCGRSWRKDVIMRSSQV